ncbi:MAG TPA: ferritin-like domain-containing protein, partial [Chitinivibrionales bacterium]
YAKLHSHFRKRSIDEMQHAEKLIARIIFLEGVPVVSEYRKITIGPEIAKQLEHDHALEASAIASYNDAIKVAGDTGDFATREILESILHDEDGHIDDIEERLDQLSHMGAALFLSSQVKE